MIKIGSAKKGAWKLEAVMSTDKKAKELSKKHLSITECLEGKKAFMYIDVKKYTNECFKYIAERIVKSNKRDYNIDTATFVSKKINAKKSIKLFVYNVFYLEADLWNKKTKKKDKFHTITLTNASAFKKEFTEAEHEAKAVNFARCLQIMAPNWLNSESYAKIVSDKFKDHKNVSVKVLGKTEAKKHKMGLFLGVNAGSAYEPKVVILKYKGNPSSKENTVVVGKGITFDAGGYNIKTGRFMNSMKFDMSGSAIAAGAVKLLALSKAKANLTAVLMLTDNMINSEAITPDTVLIASNGKSVEVNNTDAEGRLALADGLVYAEKQLKATRIIDAATLTGAVISALGSTYVGTWTTKDGDWKKFEAAAADAKELVWRMPLHKDYFDFMSKSDVADFKNTDLTGKAGSSSAAMFLTQFIDKVPYIHLDVAGTADVSDKPTGVMVKTIAQFAKNLK